MSSARHSARAPTKLSVTSATSTSAISVGRSPTITSRRLLEAKATFAGTRPLATRPAARPVTVGSRWSGNALLVPVDMPAMGTSPHSRTTARWVPSPPSTTMAATLARRISSRRARAVGRRSGDRHVEIGDFRKAMFAQIAGALDAARHVAANAAMLGHHEDAVNAAGRERGQDAHDDIGPVGDLQTACAGDDAAKVAGRDWIGDDADDGPHDRPPLSYPSLPSARTAPMAPFALTR